jgi:uncharacterized RDD family membrane protein YckC
VLQRLLAWAVDLGALVAPAMALPTVVRLSLGELLGEVPGRLAGLGLWGLALIAIPAIQAKWRTTPGKWLFQLRIVDAHGLSPSPRVLATRSMLQFLPVWMGACNAAISFLGMPAAFRGLLFGVAGLAMCVDGCAMLLTTRRALHDRALNTRVVLASRGE